MKTPDNPPAFPLLESLKTHGEDSNGDKTYHASTSAGMTLRDWFAGQALSAHLSDSGTLACAKDVVKGTSVSIQEAVASMAYVFADAMLAERAKGGK